MPTFLRVLLGTTVYVLIVVLAAPFPAAAGLMLTFPALNGLAFVFAERARVLGMARSMIWMPGLNGVLCAGFILAFLALAHAVLAAVLVWPLAVAVVVLWTVISFRPKVLEGIPFEHQRSFALMATVLGALLVVGAVLVAGRTPDAATTEWQGVLSWSFAGQAVARNWAKIVLFALCLAAFLLGTRLLPLSDGVRGILAGLPFVPVAGLLSVAGDDGIELAARLEILRRMAVSVWLAPALPAWFVYGFSRYLARTPREGDGAVHDLPALLLAWALCGIGIAGVTYALR